MASEKLENMYHKRLYAYECMCDPQNYWIAPQIEIVWKSVNDTYASLPDKSDIQKPKKRH